MYKHCSHHQPIHRSDLPGLAAARSLGKFSSIHDVAGVPVVLFQHRGARSHILSEDILVNAFLESERSVGVS